ncbi:MAG: phosphotriesterase [Verrucomicrobia bacterium]|nr:phosphotriesterase [Verrucomicrobiota bacterium]
MHRRAFLGFTTAALLASRVPLRAAAIPGTPPAPGEPTVMTVRGPVAAAQLGLVLPHEHVLVDFIGAADVSPARYDAGVAFAKIKPFLDEAHDLGCRTFFECTPAFLGRDPRLLVRLSEATGLRLVTNTGYYAARQNKFLPAHALTESADELAARWQREWTAGIDGTGVRPGFIKIGLDAGPLTPAGRKLAQAAARTHRATGLAIAAHTGDHVAALAQLAVLRDEGVHPSAWIWVHAQNAKDAAALTTAARAGAWLSFDGVAPPTLARHVASVVDLKRQGFLDQLLVSHDAGWYRPGEPDGGAFRGYDALFRAFLPAVRREGFADAEIARLTVENPARAFATRVRVAGGG